MSERVSVWGEWVSGWMGVLVSVWIYVSETAWDDCPGRCVGECLEKCVDGCVGECVGDCM